MFNSAKKKALNWKLCTTEKNNNLESYMGEEEKRDEFN